ncbi:hypothetical protein ACP70R_008794 [Stipagrostis hirtigluma subsp. patula]
MAAVLDALAPYVKKLIGDMAEEEVYMLLGVSGEIKKLEGNTEGLKYFLADAERRRLTDQSVQRWVMKLKGTMYDATDILDLCRLEADERRESKCSSWSKMMPSCLQPLLFCLRNPVHAHKIGNRIKELNQQLDDIHKEASRFNFNINLGSSPEPRKSIDVEHYSRKTTSEFVESAIVGQKIEEDTKKLVQELTNNGNYNIKVVSIVGMGGIGKTTLAQKIFKETPIEEHFKIKVWLSITQHFNETELLMTAIKHAGGHHGGEQNKTLLTRILTDTLSQGKFLLVMDDVWSSKAWDDVLGVPVRKASRKQPGSRVLVTTRSEDLVQRMQATFHQYHVRSLDNEDAWSLLKKQLPPNQVVGIDQLKEIGMRIVEKCDGLPLAVKVMGGLLSTRYPSEHDWKDVLNDSAWSVSGLPKELDNPIYLSYEDLCPQLKQCFLYCSLFPKGESIWITEAVPMWISEGFIQPQDRSSSHDDRLEELATKYYRQLIMRNLIEPTHSSSNTGYECTMHDVVRSFAQFVAREELLVVQDVQAARRSNESSIRHLSIGSTESVLEWADLQKHKSLRTLVLNCRVDLPRDSLTSFPSLRVLRIKYADCDKLVDSLCHLRHLRYLRLEETNISKLPDNINRMKFLQHIILDSCPNLAHLPSSITKLVHLRTLDMEYSNINVVPKGIGGLTNLRMLKGFPVHMGMDGGWCSLEEIASLSQLRDLTVKGLENMSSSSFAEKAMISSKSHLSYLRLNCSSSRSIGSGDEIEQRQRTIEEVFDKLCPPNCIKNLGMERYFGCRLPHWMSVPATAAFKSLRFLHFEELTSCIRLLDGLCRLPCLEAFTIIGAPAIKSVGPEFQAASSLAVGGGAAATSAAFPKLRNLVLVGLSEWEEWEWEEQGEDAAADTIAMPALETLYIDNCKLSRLPPGLANSKRHALRELNLYEIANLTSVENFPSVVDLDVMDCPELKRISGLSRLQKTRIIRCPNVEVLEGVPVLDSLVLEDTTMDTLPGYLQRVSPRYLHLVCGKNFYDSLFSASSSELEKISHIRSRNIEYWPK